MEDQNTPDTSQKCQKNLLDLIGWLQQFAYVMGCT